MGNKISSANAKRQKKNIRKKKKRQKQLEREDPTHSPFTSISEEITLSDQTFSDLRGTHHESMFTMDRIETFPNLASKSINMLIVDSGHERPTEVPGKKDVVEVEYTGFVGDHDRGEPFVDFKGCIALGQKGNVRGLEKALRKMTVGSTVKLWIPARLAYGERGNGDAVPPNSNLFLQLKLIQIVSD